MKNRICTFCILLIFITSVFAQKPIAVCNNSFHNFGIIEGEKTNVSHTFYIKNYGKLPLIINDVTTTCNCISFKYSKKPIEPGKTGEIIVTYNSSSNLGIFTKNISVYTNATKKPLALRIKGEVK